LSTTTWKCTTSPITGFVLFAVKLLTIKLGLPCGVPVTVGPLAGVDVAVGVDVDVAVGLGVSVGVAVEVCADPTTMVKVALLF
jgi:hypothetical protein